MKVLVLSLITIFYVTLCYAGGDPSCHLGLEETLIPGKYLSPIIELEGKVSNLTIKTDAIKFDFFGKINNKDASTGLKLGVSNLSLRVKVDNVYAYDSSKYPMIGIDFKKDSKNAHSCVNGKKKMKLALAPNPILVKDEKGYVTIDADQAQFYTCYDWSKAHNNSRVDETR